MMENQFKPSAASPFLCADEADFDLFVVDPDHGRRARIAHTLGKEGIYATPLDSARQLLGPFNSRLSLIVHYDDFADHEQAIWNLKSASPQVAVVVYAQTPSLRNVVRAIRAGALDYFTWPEENDGLIASIKSLAAIYDHIRSADPTAPPAAPPAAASSDYAAVAILDNLISSWNDERRRRSSARQRIDKLTRREREILTLLSHGLSSVQIAEALAISPRTVETHRANILIKIDVRSTAEAVRYAVESGAH